MPTLVAQLELGPPLRSVAERGYAFVPAALDEAFRARLAAEIAAGPFRQFREEFGQVRQQIDGYDVDAPFDGFAELAALCRDLTRGVREQGTGIRGLASWRVTEVGIAHYRPGSIGITPHMDGKGYRALVAVVTLHGTAPFAICSDREGTVIEGWDARPGDLTLMRGPGLGGVADGRPLHMAGTPPRGERTSIGLRMKPK
ncbi:MAG TPA: hypothetical protein VGH10_05565 [Actinomycetota bacterium]|jgi:hypothetical protein